MHKRKTSKYLISGILVLLFGCLNGSLQAADQSERATVEAAGAETAASAETEPAAAANPSPAALASTINEMRELIDNQRRQIEKLQSTLEKQQQDLNKAISAMETKTAPVVASAAAPSPSAPASAAAEDTVGDVELMKGELEAVADSTAQANQRIAKLETDTAADRKSNDAKLKQLGIFTFGGDIRARAETFSQEGIELRHRDRFRLRFNVTGKISDEFNVGFSLATGSLDDPVSTNQTMTGFFNRKNIGVDRAFVTYTPKYAKFLRLDAGKFAFPWYRTGLTFDSDVNPDGFAQTLNFDVKSPVLTNIKIVGFQLPFNEVSGGLDSFIYGGQVQAQFRMGSKARMGVYFAGMEIQRPDPIAVAIFKKTLQPSLPNSNTYRYDANNQVIGYATGFAYLDTIVKLDVDAHPRFPISVLFDFVNNARGSSERNGYWTEFTVGSNKEAKDVQFGYSFIRIEKDAVISAWNESDLRSGTNVRNHKISASYMLHSKVTGQFTMWVGKFANSSESYLKRSQFDVVYKF